NFARQGPQAILPSGRVQQPRDDAVDPAVALVADDLIAAAPRIEGIIAAGDDGLPSIIVDLRYVPNLVLVQRSHDVGPLLREGFPDLAQQLQSLGPRPLLSE